MLFGKRRDLIGFVICAMYDTFDAGSLRQVRVESGIAKIDSDGEFWVSIFQFENEMG
jgi:hypothetical protein